MSASVPPQKFAAPICPILSAVPRQSSLVGGQGQQQAVSCQGPNCAWFLPQTDSTSGQIVGGACAVAALAVEMNQSNLREAEIMNRNQKMIEQSMHITTEFAKQVGIDPQPGNAEVTPLTLVNKVTEETPTDG